MQPAEHPLARTITPGDTIIVARSSAVLVEGVEFADTPLRRFCGLMLRANLPERGGLWLSPCNSIHMQFMRFPIDVVWLDSEKRVLAVSSKLRPWLGMASCRGARIALEINAGRAADLLVGDQLIRREF